MMKKNGYANLKYEARQIVAECRVKGFPMAMAAICIFQLCKEYGYPPPLDPLAFAMSD